MNLELIKKYEKEFLHMLHGGKVLMGKKDSVTNTIKWYPSVLNPFVETSESILIVIDDIYCTYRKALTEGKKIQFFNTKERLYDSSKPLHTWQDIDTICTHGMPSDYRIKPEEPKFKVGDWITVNGPAGTFTECISGIADDTYTLSGTNICYKSQATKWEPKAGEVCIFWDNSHTNEVMIARYSHSERSFYYPLKRPNTCYQNCMPFIGTLPPHMKDN